MGSAKGRYEAMVDPDARTRISESKPDPFVGRTIDGYRVEELLGRGGMGAVYRAMQLSLGRPVALKVLPEDLAEDRQFLERFRREADVLSRLAHPNVVTVYDRGEVDGRPYLVLEYVDGTSLRAVMRKGALPPEEALRIVSSVLHALDHAHRCGVVHRDVKPENVLLARGGVVKVADFGLSRLLGPETDTRLTRTHLQLGTFEYMAPEQREHAREADARSDLYATGVVLYEMLTGELPIGRFDLPSHKRPTECDRRIDDLVAKSLEKAPERRYQDAQEMADDVSAILERPEPQGPSPTVGERPSYKPVRFEYHVDNVATLDHVLGTLCYVGAFVALFARPFRMWLVIPWWGLFVVGWYLRDTADNLRKFKDSARTAQAVIAILSFFTVVLAPIGLYSLWALFGARGRTYYEARARGLGPVEAARHTYRLFEEPAPWVRRTYEGTAEKGPEEARPPTPSQIPVQSQVVSAAKPAPARRRGMSPLVLLGFLLGVLGVWGGMALTETQPWAAPLVGPAVVGSGILLLLGMLHALLRGRKGAGLAFVGLLLLGFLAWRQVPAGGVVAEDPVPMRGLEIGELRRTPPQGFARAFFQDEARVDWLRGIADVGDGFPLGVRLEWRDAKVWLLLPETMPDDDEHLHRIGYAVSAALQKALGGGSLVTIGSDTAFMARVSRNPPP